MLLRYALVIVALSATAATGAPDSDSLPHFPAGSRGGFWIEGPDNTILMAYNASDGKGHIAISSDLGLSWRIVSASQQAGPLTRLADGSLLMVRERRNERDWVQSLDQGRTWSKPKPIPVKFKYPVYCWGPIVEASDGRWAYCPYAQNGNLNADALIVWSSDRGQTWSKPIAFPTPSDGNKGLTELALVQLDDDSFLAAIRSDDVENGGFDGFYFSQSDDGLTWSVPRPVGDRGRQPHFFRLQNCLALTYRQWLPEASTNFSAVRFSTKGSQWSRPYRIQEGVQDGACLVQINGTLIAFNQLYPESTTRTRYVVQVPDAKDWFAAPAPKGIQKVALRSRADR